MKRFYQLLSLVTVFVLSLNAKAQDADSMMISRMDSVEISLLTCSPHEAIYSLYGHTAIRINDQRNGEDLAVNYGLFSFEKPHFVLRFLFGLTDYEMSIEPFEAFCRQYRYYRKQCDTAGVGPDERGEMEHRQSCQYQLYAREQCV